MKRLGGKPLHLAVALLLSATLAIASTVTPARRPAAPVLLKGGDIHTVSGGVLAKTDLLLVDGKFAAVGATFKAPAGTQVIDVTGKRIYPGLISASSPLGLEEIASVRATVDTKEIGTITPNVRAQVAFNADSEMIPVTRANGVLTVHTRPEVTSDTGHPRSIIAGQSALMRLDGWTWEDMTVRARVGLQVYWPLMPINRGPRPVPGARDPLKEQLTALRSAFDTARAYLTAKAGAPAETDLRWEAMIPALKGEQPVFVHADDLRQISAALDWAHEENLKMILVGGRDAWRVADRLKAADIPVIIDGTHNLPLRRDDGYDDVYANAGRLHAAGVRFCIANSGDTKGGATNARNLPYEAAMAAAFGLPPAEALKAITLYPAQILGVGAELGSIETGKRATLIVTDGDPLEIPTQVLHAFIDGAQIQLHSRHTQLYDKYRQRYGK
jgi:imidazolonepropionase-like amidohydrolase